MGGLHKPDRLDLFKGILDLVHGGKAATLRRGGRGGFVFDIDLAPPRLNGLEYGELSHALHGHGGIHLAAQAEVCMRVCIQSKMVQRGMGEEN